MDVAYLIEARVDLTDRADPGESVGQHLSIFRRRVRQQRFFRQPYLGMREFDASIVDAGDLDRVGHESLRGARDLGWMIYDRTGRGKELRFFRPTMVDGIVDLTNLGDTPFAI